MPVLKGYLILWSRVLKTPKMSFKYNRINKKLQLSWERP